ncbi:MAG: ATP-binding protein [Bacteroidia bacterium]
MDFEKLKIITFEKLKKLLQTDNQLYKKISIIMIEKDIIFYLCAMQEVNKNYIIEVYEASFGVSSFENAIKKCEPQLQQLVAIYKNQLSKEECFCLALVVGYGFNNQGDSHLNIKSIAKILKCKGADVLMALPVLDGLFVKGLVNRLDSRSSFRYKPASAFDVCYFLSSKQLRMVLNNKIDFLNDKKYSTLDSYLRRLGNIFELIENQEIEFNEGLEIFIDIFLLNQHLKINDFVLKFLSQAHNNVINYQYIESKVDEDIMAELMVLLLLIKHSREGDSICLNEVLEKIMGFGAFVYQSIRDILDGKHLLLTGKYLVKDDVFEIMAEDGSYLFSSRFYKYFQIKNRSAIHLNDENQDLVMYKNIKTKSLFFNETLQQKLKELIIVLEPSRFKKTSSLLKSKFKKQGGLTVLFHGGPGTGKTEFVYQLAKVSKRDIYKIDLSGMKNMWYGQSEKMVKRAFDEYRYLCKNKKNIPIMFINEADGLLGQRLNVERTIDQTNNTIQNILLEEIERFEGILLCTTNLIQNLDSAFERRFLFKIKFELPNKTVQAKLWSYYFNEQLSENDIEKLSQHYSLSPAQIANIAYKAALKDVLGEKICLNTIHQLASEEWLLKSNKLGF